METPSIIPPEILNSHVQAHYCYFFFLLFCLTHLSLPSLFLLTSMSASLTAHCERNELCFHGLSAVHSRSAPRSRLGSLTQTFQSTKDITISLCLQFEASYPL